MSQSNGVHETAAVGAAGTACTSEVHEAIERAKQDWESTADTLPHIICLLNEQSRALRVNKAVESWQLARVSDALGQNVHDILHPGGCTRHCALRQRLEAAWTDLRAGRSIEFELHDTRLKRLVTVALRPIAGDSPKRLAGTEARAVMVMTDITPLLAARQALETLNESLGVRILERTRALEAANTDLQKEIRRRESAEEALQQSRGELELLSQQLIHAQERERQRISQELHDSVGQSMSAIKYSLERAAELHRQGKYLESQRLVQRTIEGLRDTTGEIRSIAMGLRPSVLDDLGVASALEWLCRRFGETYADMKIHTCISVSDSDIPQRLATTLFRCAQELLNNVAKHAKARRVSIALVQSSNALVLRVCDDGVGLPAASASGSYGMGHGIRNLRERAQMTGGILSLSCNSGGGTRAEMQWTVGKE